MRNFIKNVALSCVSYFEIKPLIRFAIYVKLLNGGKKTWEKLEMVDINVQNTRFMYISTNNNNKKRGSFSGLKL